MVSPFLDDSCMSLYVFVSNQSLVFAILSQGVSTDLVNLIRKSRDEPNGRRHVLHISQVNIGVPRKKNISDSKGLNFNPRWSRG